MVSRPSPFNPTGNLMLILIITAVLAVLLQLILPWWSAPLAAFMVAVSFQQGAFRAFLNGFLAIFLVWSLTAAGISIYNDGVLAERLAALFSLPSGWMVVPLTGLIGGLPAGMAALTGNMIRKAWKKPGDAVDNTTGASLAAQPTGPAVLNTEAAEALSGLNPPSQTAESRTGGQPSSRGTDSTASADHHKETGRESDPANPAESDSTHDESSSKK